MLWVQMAAVVLLLVGAVSMYVTRKPANVFQWILAGFLMFLAIAPETAVTGVGSRQHVMVLEVVVGVLGIALLVTWGQVTATRHRAERAFAIINQVVDDQALADFEREYGHPTFHPITVVIPAYNEAENIGDVLTRIPRKVHGVPVSVLVVVDGSHDGTDDIVRQHGDYVCQVRVNRGQGAALRVGYRLAIMHDARYIVTLDADGQYVPSEMPALVEPLLTNEADYVQGSRRLGNYVTDDAIRMAGVYFFGWLIASLTRQRITDSSNGFRAIKSHVLQNLRLTEDQYHAAELLILSIRKGYRVVERPASMHPRPSGTTKKGPNVIYGYHYARVILKSWLRAV